VAPGYDGEIAAKSAAPTRRVADARFESVANGAKDRAKPNAKGAKLRQHAGNI
jgi:hypothetical protein